MVSKRLPTPHLSFSDIRLLASLRLDLLFCAFESMRSLVTASFQDGTNDRPPPGIHNFVLSPPTVHQHCYERSIERGRRMCSLSLDYKRHHAACLAFSLLLRSPAPGKANVILRRQAGGAGSKELQASCQQPREWAILEANPPASVKPGDDCLPEGSLIATPWHRLCQSHSAERHPNSSPTENMR